MKFLSFTKVIGCVAICASLASADSLQLRNGRHLQGRYIGGTTNAIGFMTAGAVEYFATSDVLVLIFHSREAATWFDPTGMSDGPGFRGDLRAQIELREGSATVRITPIGMMSPYFQPTWRGDAIIGEAVYDTRLPLPLPLTPHCRLEIDDRCLLALSTLQYPADLANAGIAGEVSVYVTADRTGLRTTVVAEKSAIPAALVQAAIENLKTWRLEVSTHATTFRVTLVYVLDGAFHGLYPDVAFDLPGRVTIRARRP